MTPAKKTRVPGPRPADHRHSTRSDLTAEAFEHWIRMLGYCPPPCAKRLPCADHDNHPAYDEHAADLRRAQ